MRIRQVKPEFWRDSRLSTLNDTARLIYIGLWMEADDAGWLRYSIEEIASDLYPYATRGVREKKVEQAFDHLASLGRVEPHDCGHAYIPTLTTHQRFASPEKRVLTFTKEHERCIPAGTRGSPRFPAETRDGTVRNGKEREGLGTEGVRGNHDGSKNLERDDGITRALTILQNPTASQSMKEAARAQLQRLGYVA